MSNWLWWLPAAQVSIEEATDRDVGALAAVHAACFAHDWSADEIAALMRDDHVFGYVARRANAFGTKRPVGFLLVRAVVDEAEVLTVAVLPSHRGRGIARRLLEASFRRLYRDRAAAIFLEVDGGNAPALGLYRKLGFVKVGERKGYYRTANGPAAAALVMKADLR